MYVFGALLLLFYFDSPGSNSLMRIMQNKANVS